MRQTWVKPKFCGNFLMEVTWVVRPCQIINEHSVSLGLVATSRQWEGYFYLSARDARLLSSQLIAASVKAEKAYRGDRR